MKFWFVSLSFLFSSFSFGDLEDCYYEFASDRRNRGVAYFSKEGGVFVRSREPTVAPTVHSRRIIFLGSWDCRNDTVQINSDSLQTLYSKSYDGFEFLIPTSIQWSIMESMLKDAASRIDTVIKSIEWNTQDQEQQDYEVTIFKIKIEILLEEIYGVYVKNPYVRTNNHELHQKMMSKVKRKKLKQSRLE